MRSGDVTIRAIDDISEVVLSAAEIKAIASGNPKVIRKVQLATEAPIKGGRNYDGPKVAKFLVR